MNELPSSSTGPHVVDLSPFVSHNYDAPMKEKEQPQNEDNSEAEAIPLSQNPAYNAQMKAKEDELERQVELERDTEREKKLERKRQNQKRERQAERERQVQARIRHREREMRLQRMQNENVIRPPRPRIMAMEDPYDSSESGYWSINDRRPKTRTEQMWDRMAARERRIEAEKEKQKQKEDKQELDAMFHVMLHGCGDDLCLSDGGEYEYKLPAFLRFDEVKRGFQEQMKKEKADREARLAREEKERQMAENQPKQEEKPTRCQGCCSHSNSYNFPPINTDWTTTKDAVKQRKKNNVIIVSSSSDEEGEIQASSQRAAVKWTSCSSTVTSANSTVTSANSTVATASSTVTRATSSVITVHDSDSDSD